LVIFVHKAAALSERVAFAALAVPRDKAHPLVRPIKPLVSLDLKPQPAPNFFHNSS